MALAQSAEGVDRREDMSALVRRKQPTLLQGCLCESRAHYKPGVNSKYRFPSCRSVEVCPMISCVGKDVGHGSCSLTDQESRPAADLSGPDALWNHDSPPCKRLLLLLFFFSFFFSLLLRAFFFDALCFPEVSAIRIQISVGNLPGANLNA
jgi:hypothetical protein